MSPTPDRLYHYTCAHGAQGIRRDGVVRPSRHTLLDLELAWFTDLDVPARKPLGLTSYQLKCDRTEHRFEVSPDGIRWWPRFARCLPRAVRQELESAPGSMPAHWWVSTEPVPVQPPGRTT